MIQNLLVLALGVLFAGIGGVWFVDGAVGLAKWARWPAAVIGATVAAFGTSSPELLVAVHSALDGIPEISLGDVLGSNIVNITLILAVGLIVAPLKANDDGLKRDWCWALTVPLMFAAVLWDGWFSRLDATLLMSLFFAWLAALIRHARSHAASQDAMADEVAPSKAKLALLLFGGLGMLVLAAQFVVHGGKGVADLLGWSPFVVGVVVVSVATSTPELATTLIAQVRGHHDVGLANILGSNVFNALFIASCAALIKPYAVDFSELLPSLGFGLLTTAVILPGKSGILGRGRGYLLLAFYIAYLWFTLHSGSAVHGP